MIPACPDCKKEELEAYVNDSKKVVLLHCKNCGWMLNSSGLDDLNNIKAKTPEDFYFEISQVLSKHHESIRV